MVHTVTATELETVASLSKSVHLAFFGLCVGALIAFGIVLSTSNIAEPLIHSAYVALLAVSGVGSLYFGIRAVIDYREARNKLAAITAGRQ